MKNNNALFLKLLWTAISLIVVGIFVVQFNNLLAAVDDVVFVVSLAVFVSAFFIDNDAKITIKISLPVGITFFVLFAAVPLPALIFRNNPGLGVAGSLFFSVILIVFCAWFARKTSPNE